jgi:hypothetical protein
MAMQDMIASSETYAIEDAALADDESSQSGVSWGAIIAGAFAAAALSLILLSLGAGFGFSSASPWSNAGASAKTIGVAAVIWLVVTQWLSAAVGGYLAGRLRTKWSGIHSDEVYFRDTAHGFLAWAVGAVISIGLLTSAVSSLVATGLQAGATVAGPAVQGATQAAAQAAGNAGSTDAYYVDLLFRSDKPAPDANDASVRAEVGRILATGLRNGDVSPADRHYLAQVVAARTGLSPADAEKRVNEVIANAKTAATDAANKAKQAADEARSAAAYLAFATCLSMLIGAFVASAAGALGGHRREANEQAEMGLR